MRNSEVEKFIGALSDALEKDTFVKAALGNYKGPEVQLQKVSVRLISTRRGLLLQFVKRFADREEARNYSEADALRTLEELLEGGFHSGRIFATEGDLQLELGRSGKWKLSNAPATFTETPGRAHDKPKSRVIDPAAKYLQLLGISTGDGRVKDKQQAKYRQVNRFADIAGGLIEEAGFERGSKVTVTDMGSGKGYLTFALYDRLANGMGLEVEMRGVEAREHLVETCNEAARDCGFDGLAFVKGEIGTVDAGMPDMLIALHACDTATDDALFEGITSASKIIIAAPCCQKELRKQLRYPEALNALNRYGLILERETESVTDGLRAVLLESCGYKVRMQEFISPEHTPKNNLITALLSERKPEFSGPFPEAESIMNEFGIDSQRLHTLLSGPRGTEPLATNGEDDSQ